MSKFIKIAQGVAPNTNGQPAQSGAAPQVLPSPNVATPNAAPVAKPPTPQMTNYFAQANIDPNQYVGTAEQNEKLRRVLDPTNTSKTFYEAYMNKFNQKWDAHPSERKNKLSGGLIQNTPQQAQGQVQQGAPNPNGQNPNTSQAAPAYPPLPQGFQRSQSGIVIPPLPR